MLTLFFEKREAGTEAPARRDEKSILILLIVRRSPTAIRDTQHNRQLLYLIMLLYKLIVKWMCQVLEMFIKFLKKIGSSY